MVFVAVLTDFVAVLMGVIVILTDFVAILIGIGGERGVGGGGRGKGKRRWW